MTDLQNNNRLLIVEDDLIISLVIEKMAKKLGLEVIGKATSGRDAIKLALELDPDIIFMDIRLDGEIDGIDAVIAIMEEKSPSVIFITGNSDAVNFERAKTTQFVDLITKPFTLQDLQNSLDLI